MFRLRDGFYDIFTVDQKREGFSHACRLLYGLACKKLAVYVEAAVIGTERIDFVEFRCILYSCHDIGCDRIDELQGAILERVVNSGIVST